MIDHPQIGRDEKAAPRDETYSRLVAEWDDAPTRLRILLTVYLAIGAAGGLYGGYALPRALDGWIPWAVGGFIVEPIGVVCLLALVVFYFPTSPLGVRISRAISRAKLALFLIALAIASGFVFVVVMFAIEFWKLRGAAV